MAALPRQRDSSNHDAAVAGWPRRTTVVFGCAVILLAIAVAIAFGANGHSDWVSPPDGPKVAREPLDSQPTSGEVLDSVSAKRTDLDRAAVIDEGMHADPPKHRVLSTFLKGQPVASVMLHAGSPRRAGMAFEARPRSSRHVLADSMVALADDQLALCHEDATIALLRVRDVGPGETRVDLQPTTPLRLELYGAPQLLQTARLDAQIAVSHYLSDIERFAWISMSCGLLPREFANQTTTFLPRFVMRDGEITVCARSRSGGPGYTVKKTFTAADTMVRVDVSELAFCTFLADVDVTIGFASAHPAGKLRLALIDQNGSCLTSETVVRGDEPSLGMQFRGIKPGVYVPELQTEERLSIRLAEIRVLPSMQATAPTQRVEVRVCAESSIDVFVESADPIALKAARVLVIDEQGRILGDPARRGERRDLFHLRSLPKGTYFVQVLAEDHAMASRVAEVRLGEAEEQQVSVLLQAAGRVEVAGSPAGETFVLVAVDGQECCFFLAANRTRFWCPVGQYSLRGSEQAIAVLPAVSVKVELDQGVQRAGGGRQNR